MDPQIRRLAVPTEDHPVEYLSFQGDIPAGNYGAGQHRIWDRGSYTLLDADDPEEVIAKGKLKLKLKGDKLKGVFNLFRLGSRDQWLLVKGKDEYAEPGWKLELLIPNKDGSRFLHGETQDKRAARPRSRAAKGNAGVIKKSAKPAKDEKLTTIAGVMKTKTPKGDKRAKVGEFALDLTSLDKVYWPDEGYTKMDLIRYYYQVSKFILPYLNERPLIMKRYPAGIGGKSFHQHDVDEVPEFVRTIALEAEDGGAHAVDYVVCDNLQTHLYLANLGAIERHPWHSRTSRINTPDWIVFDLDPGEAVEFQTICEVSVIARDVIKELGLDSYAKTSGSRGIHIYVPIEPRYPFDVVADVAAHIAKLVADRDRKTATVERSKKNRKKGQIYIDHMQNAYGKSVVAPYSVRPRPGATVSAPLEWDEVSRAKISTEDFTIDNIIDRIKRKGDIFTPVLTDKQSLDAVIETIKKPATRSAAGRRSRSGKPVTDV